MTSSDLTSEQQRQRARFDGYVQAALAGYLANASLVTTGSAGVYSKVDMRHVIGDAACAMEQADKHLAKVGL